MNNLFYPLLISIVLSGASPLVWTEDSEVRLGRKEHEKLMKTTHFYDDEALNAYVDRIGQSLAANSDWPEIDYHFFIVDSPAINAFALPGGYIYINRGLLAYMTSEAQLASVLAHEIAHVTKHHGVRRKNQQQLGNAVATIASIATFNSNVGEAIKLENSVRVSGYGRDMELEADEYGAKYLVKTGYEPSAMIEVLSVLKNHERFSVLQSREAGKEPQTYHGVFSSHPKNDKRLQEVVAQAGEIPPGEGIRGRDEYRKMLDGMVFGENDTRSRLPGYLRYASKGLGVTFSFPEGWSRKTSGQKIVLTDNTSIQMELTVAKPTNKDATSKELLQTQFNVDSLHKVKPVYEDKDKKDDASIALVATDLGLKRVGVIKYGSYEYYFEAVSPVPASKEIDDILVDIIKSFRRAQPQDYPPEKIAKIYFHRLEPGEFISDLAANKDIGRYTEDYFRLMNGYYPTGNPEPGTWLKLAR